MDVMWCVHGWIEWHVGVAYCFVGRGCFILYPFVLFDVSVYMAGWRLDGWMGRRVTYQFACMKIMKSICSICSPCLFLSCLYRALLDPLSTSLRYAPLDGSQQDTVHQLINTTTAII